LVHGAAPMVPAARVTAGPVDTNPKVAVAADRPLDRSNAFEGCVCATTARALGTASTPPLRLRTDEAMQ
jgi:hypothetical protein